MQNHLATRAMVTIGRGAIEYIRSPLCSACCSLIKQWKELRCNGHSPDSEVSSIDQASIYLLLAAAASGCSICTSVKQNIEKNNGSLWRYFDDCRGSSWFGLTHESFVLRGGNDDSRMWQTSQALPIMQEHLNFYDNLECNYTGNNKLRNMGKAWL